MNPFQLTGFSFLTFYLLVGIAVIWGMRLWFRQSETAGAPPTQNLTDPYLIAHLRDGHNEALRVATVSLLDRGLLTASGDLLTTRDGKVWEMVKRPIEKAIMRLFSEPTASHEVFKDAACLNACSDYANALKKQGLLADAGTYATRLVPVAIALAILIGVSWTKITIAFSQGRHNVGFLVFLTIVFCVIALVTWRRRRTGLGDAMLTDLRSLFSRLKGRAKSLRAGGQTNEAALLAAVFGLAALPAASFPFMDKLYPARSGSGSSCGTSSSSSCSSSSSSCSGGCGGGGCGG